MWLDGWATVASSADMDGQFCRFIGQPSSLVPSFDVSHHISMAATCKWMKIDKN
jgi:hypothetical protein